MASTAYEAVLAAEESLARREAQQQEAAVDVASFRNAAVAALHSLDDQPKELQFQHGYRISADLHAIIQRAAALPAPWSRCLALASIAEVLSQPTGMPEEVWRSCGTDGVRTVANALTAAIMALRGHLGAGAGAQDMQELLARLQEYNSRLVDPYGDEDLQECLAAAQSVLQCAGVDA